jgi:hypothetical protein
MIIVNTSGVCRWKTIEDKALYNNSVLTVKIANFHEKDT